MSKRPLRVGMLTPNMSLGGAECWIADLISHTDPARIKWTGVALSGWGGLNPKLAQVIRSAGTEIFSHRVSAKPPGFRETMDYNLVDAVCVNYERAVHAVVESADVIVCWGSPNMGHWLGHYTVPRVLVSQTTLKEPNNSPITGITHLVGCSKKSLDWFIGRPDVERLPMDVIYNGSNPLRCQPELGREAIRAQWGVEQQVVVGYLGRQSPEKNYMAAAQAVKHLGAGYAAVYYGYDPTARQFAPDLQQFCYNELPGRHCLNSPVPNLGDALAGIDVFMLASHREAGSLGMREAWLVGKPVVATQVGDVDELEEQYGRLVHHVPINPRPEDLASAVCEAINPGQVHVQRRAKQVAEEHFTVASMAASYTEYLEKICSGS